MSLACFLEATAPKPGNVHRGADFEDLTYADLVTAAIVIGQSWNERWRRRLGETVLEAVQATQAAVGTNANLGTILLIAPLAAVSRDGRWPTEFATCSTRWMQPTLGSSIEAIREAKPGGLGRVNKADIAASRRPI